MLIKLKREELEKYIEYAYLLSLDLSKTCYPTYADGIKTKKDFIKAAQDSFEKENDEIYLFYYNEKLEGWIHFYFIPEDNYFTCENFAVECHIDVALNELYSLIKERFLNCNFYFGCSMQNALAITFLEKNSFEKIEESSVCIFHFDDYQIQEDSCKIRRITKETFADFVELHHPFDMEMYWDCKRILENFEKWHIYVLYENDQPMAAIYFVCSKMLLEIFGVDYQNNLFNSKHFELLMIKVLNEGKKLGAKPLYYFAEVKELESLKKIGYDHFDDYVCYCKKVN